MSDVAVRRVWLGLWAAAAGLVLILLFATLVSRPPDPEALLHFPAEVLERGRQFSREVRVAASLKSLASMAAMLVLCFSRPGARALRVLEAAGRGRLWAGVTAVAFGVTLLTTMVELPFAYYLGFWHEQAYGLSRQTPGNWVADHLLGVGLDLILAMLFWLPLYWLIRRWPRRWWAPGALVYMLFSGALTVLSPVLLMPLFNQIVPVNDPAVLSMVRQLSERAGVKVEAVREMRVSERTSRTNAMVTGLGATKQVIVYNTLLQQFSPAEVEIVLAHELSHAVENDVLKGWLLSTGIIGVGLLLSAGVLRGMVGMGPVYLTAPHGARGLALLVLLMTLLGEVAAPVENVVSRQMEVRADRFALEITGRPEAFLSGFKKLAAGNPGDVDPPPLVEFLDHSHPSVMHRIRAAAQAGVH